MHEAMKALAARHGLKAADFYVETVEVFIREHMAGYRHLFAIENDAVHISVNVPVRFAFKVRDAALGRRVTPNELVFTAVSHVLESANGRDHYIRLEWRFAWCISCRRHSRALVDLEAAELVPVVVDGEREYRVRFFREVDHIRDPFRRKLTRGSWPSGSFTALGICLEEDIRAALKGGELPDHWCLGRDWSQARAVLMDLADLLLTQAREGPQRLIHLLADGDLIPRAQASQFSRGCFTSMGAFWQRRLLEACARLLIDPNRFAHLEAGRQLNVHAELSYGRRNSHARARSVLARLAASDPLCLLLAYADEHQLLHFEERIRAWPTPLTNRMASAAAVAIYMV